MQDINTRQKKTRKDRKFQREKTQVGFLLAQFKLIRIKRRANISWFEQYPQVKIYPQLIHWVMKLKSNLKSKELLKLGCIPNYGFKDGRWECPKRLSPNNPYWGIFKEMAERLGIDQINRERAFVREVFQQIHKQTFKCYYKGQLHLDVPIEKICKQKIPAQKVDFHIQKLEEFWRQLVGRVQASENQNHIESDSDSDGDSDAIESIQNGGSQQIVEDEGEKSIIDGLEEYESVFPRIPVNQPEIRMESSRILSQDPQIEEQKQPRSPGGSRFILYKRNHSVQQLACTIQLWKSGLLTASQIEQQQKVQNEQSEKEISFFQRMNSARRGADNLRIEVRRNDKSIKAKRGTQSLDFFSQIQEYLNSNL